MTANFVTSSIQVARIELISTNISNSGAWVTIILGSPTFDDLGGTVTSTNYTVPQGGTYELSMVVNMFDNNSARVAHRERFLVNGSQPTGYTNMEGHNYMRDSTNHDSAANIYPDIFKLNAGDVITTQIQTNSSTLGSTVVLGGWFTIKKIA